METKNMNDQIKEISALINNPDPIAKEETNDTIDNEETNDYNEETNDYNEETNDETNEYTEDDIEQDAYEVKEELTDTEYKFPTNLNSLAKEIEADVSDLYNIEIGMPDGKDPVKLGELKNLYSEGLRNQTRLEDQIKHYETQGTQAQQQAQASQERINIMGKLNEVQRKYADTDWATLDQQDPGQSALLRSKFSEANNQLQNELQVAQQGEQQYQAQFHQQQMQKSAQTVLEIIPEWANDSELRTKEVLGVEALLKGEGLSDSDISQLYDPVSIKLLNELVHLREQVGIIDKSVKQVRKAPKALRNQARTKQNNKKRESDLISKAKNTTTRQGKKDAELAAAKQILFGG